MAIVTFREMDAIINWKTLSALNKITIYVNTYFCFPLPNAYHINYYAFEIIVSLRKATFSIF